MSLKKTCDFCVRRKRSCDGYARRRCSFCVETNQKECHYRPRRPRRSYTPGWDDTATQALSPKSLSGRSFWRNDEECAPAPTGRGARSAPAGSVPGGNGPLLPLKRGRFSASPATGLVGLQENEFLGDFFECLGFLSLASEGTVRGAMVGVMLAGASLRHQLHAGAPSAPQPPPALVEGIAGGVRHGIGGNSHDVDDGGWSSALAAENESGALPRDTSTCVLWCATALGALVRGVPLDHVARYVELAQDSLRACGDGATLGTARAYIAMAVLHNFLGDPVVNNKYVKLANSIVEALPPEEIPRGFREMLQYAGFAWVSETRLASAEDSMGYWENAAPIWEPFFDEKGVSRVLVAKQQHAPTATPVATVPPSDNADLQDAEEVDRVCLDNVEACAEVQRKSVMPEMLRLEACIETSPTRLGLCGLLFYGNLAYLQLLNNEPALKVSFKRCLDVLLRFPGLCRYNVWAHSAHCKLNSLAMFRSRHEYEALRASYNSVRLVGSRPAPPFEGWRGVSDVCDSGSCRRTAMHMHSLFKDYLRARSNRRAPVA